MCRICRRLFRAHTKRARSCRVFRRPLRLQGSVKSFANSAALPFLELIAGIVLMLVPQRSSRVALLYFRSR